MKYWKDYLIAASLLSLLLAFPKILNWLRVKWNIFIMCL